MPRPKKTPEYHEGPEAFERFRRLAQRIVDAGRPTTVETEEVTEERTTVTTEKRTTKPRARRSSRSRK